MLTRIDILVTIYTDIYCVGMRVYKFGCESTPCLSVRFFLTNARSLKYICSLSQYYLFKYGYFNTVTVGDVRSVALSRVYWYRGDVSLCWSWRWSAFVCVSVLVGERRMGSVHADLPSGLHASVP